MKAAQCKQHWQYCHYYFSYFREIYGIVRMTYVVHVIYRHCLRGLHRRVYASVRRQSVCPSLPSSSHTLLLQVCCCGPGGQEILSDCCTAGGQQQPRHSSKCGQCHVVSVCSRWTQRLVFSMECTTETATFYTHNFISPRCGSKREYKKKQNLTKLN